MNPTLRRRRDESRDESGNRSRPLDKPLGYELWFGFQSDQQAGRHRLKNSKVLHGSPGSVINDLAEQLIKVMVDGGVPVTPIHLLALLHLATSTMYNYREKPDNEDSHIKHFSNDVLLSVVVRNLTGTLLSEEEQTRFDDDFIKVVESLGGQVYKPGDAGFQAVKNGLFMAPLSDQVH